MVNLRRMVGLLRLRTTYLVLVIATYGFLFGLDTTAVSGTIPYFNDHYKLTTLRLEYLTASSSLGAIASSLAFFWAANRFSRKTWLLAITAFYITGCLMTGLGKVYWMWILGRLTAGGAVGVALVIAPVYICELSPKEVRGILVSFNLVALNLGLPIGYGMVVLMNATKTNPQWLFVVNSVISLFAAILLVIFVPNSPRDLIYHNRPAEARRVIHMLNLPMKLSEKEITETIDDITKAIENAGKPRVRDLFRGTNRKSIIIAFMLQVARQMSGFSTLQYFSVYLFKVIGMGSGNGMSRLMIVMLGVTQFLASIASLAVIDRLGRKKLLLLSTVSMAVGLVILGGSSVSITGFEQINKPACSDYQRCGSCLLDTRCGWHAESSICMSQYSVSSVANSNHALQLSESCSMNTVNSRIGSWLAVTTLLISLGSFSLGLGSVPWVIQSELFSQAYRGKAGGIASLTNNVFAYISNMLFLPLAFAVTLPVVFWMYAFLLVASIASVYWIIPETKGMTLEAISGNERIATDSDSTGSLTEKIEN